MKKFWKIVLVVLFPLGVIYCVGKNLFSGNFSAFLGGVFLFAIGFGLSVYLLRPDIVENILRFFVINA